MGSSSNSYTPAVPAQIRYIIQWFQEWSEMQRGDFIPILAQKFGNKGYVNGLLANMDSFCSLEDRPPSLFQCRIKLFREWADNWSESDKDQLINGLQSLDGDFMKKYEKEIASEPEFLQPDDVTLVNGHGPVEEVNS